VDRKLDYAADQWAYLEKGFMVEFSTLGLIHYEVAEEDLRLISRAES
jgi:hypothetical protein